MSEAFHTIGYLCPACRQKVIARRSGFALAASGASVECACGESTLRIGSDGTNLRAEVPCGVCGGTHTAELPLRALARGEGTGLACPKTQQLCCFLGTETAVERAMEQLAVTAEKERAHSDGDERPFTDSVIMYEVLSELREIAAREHGISCTCGSEEYAMEVRPAAVDLVCRRCGGKLRIGAATDDDLDRLCCHYTLRIKGR